MRFHRLAWRRQWLAWISRAGELALTEDPHSLERRERRRDIVNVRNELRLDSQDARARVLEHVGELLAPKRSVDRDRDRTKPRTAEQDVENLHAVLAHDHHAVARYHPGRGERTGVRGRSVAHVS